MRTQENQRKYWPGWISIWNGPISQKDQAGPPGQPTTSIKNALGIWVKREEFEWESTVLNFQSKHSPYTQRSGAVIEFIGVKYAVWTLC